MQFLGVFHTIVRRTSSNFYEKKWKPHSPVTVWHTPCTGTVFAAFLSSVREHYTYTNLRRIANSVSRLFYRCFIFCAFFVITIQTFIFSCFVLVSQIASSRLYTSHASKCWTLLPLFFCPILVHLILQSGTNNYFYKSFCNSRSIWHTDIRGCWLERYRTIECVYFVRIPIDCVTSPFEESEHQFWDNPCIPQKCYKFS